MKKLLDFFSTRPLLKHITAMLGLTLLGLILTVEFLEIYTGQGSEFSLPDFSGMSLAEANEAGKAKDLRFEVMDSVFSRRHKLGSVVDQDPPAGFKVKPGRRIFLVMNASKPEMVLMPSVLHVDFKQAWMDLEAFGLEVAKITYVDDPQHNLVLEQRHAGSRVAKGKAIEKGSGIELVLGRSEDHQMAVPNLQRVNLRNARRKLLNNFLNIGAVQYDRSVLSYEDSMRAFVYQFRPPLGHTVPLGTPISLWLTTDSARLQELAQRPSIDTSEIDLSEEEQAIDSLLKEVY